MSPAPAPERHLVLTRRGRLARTVLLLLVLVVLVAAGATLLGRAAIARSAAAGGSRTATAADAASGTPGTETPGTETSRTETPEANPSGADAAGSPAGSRSSASSPGPSEASSPAPSPSEPVPTAEDGADGGTMVHSGVAGDGTWTVAPPESAPADPAGRRVVHYAVRVEGGLGIDPAEASRQIAAVLSDPRGWQEIEGVLFVQVADPAAAEFTISLASPPTADRLCLPARTRQTWNCRTGGDVVLNSDRWTYRTPTFQDLGEYRAYMVNHEVGHFLGHGHRACPGQDSPAPVMLQQSMGLQGCAPNAWPAVSS